MSVVTAAAGVPAATAAVGDRRGVHIGETSTASRRPVMWDPWYAMEVREKSGMTPIVGDLGSGKSTLVGQIVYKTIRQRVPWVILDPSGPLARLCQLPEIARYSRAVNLLNAPTRLTQPLPGGGRAPLRALPGRTRPRAGLAQGPGAGRRW
jgi:hypothetical protein